MSEASNRVRVEEIDWQGTLPFTNIFRSFRMAIHPSKIILALVMVVFIYLWGCMLDLLGGGDVYPGEREQYQRLRAYVLAPHTHAKPKPLAAWQADRKSYNQNVLKQILTGKIAGTPHGMLCLSLEEKLSNQIINASGQPYQAVVNQINKEFKDQYEEYKNEPDKADQVLNEEDVQAKEVGKDKADEIDRCVRDPLRTAKLMEDRRYLIERVSRIRPKGVFATAVSYKLACLNELIEAFANLNLGLGELLPQGRVSVGAPELSQSASIVGVMKNIYIGLPCWLFSQHEWFSIVYIIGAFALSALFGGAIARISALHATRNERITNAAALRFGITNWLWFVLAPLLPIVFVLVIAVVLMVGGFLMNMWILDILGALLFPVALILGLVIALTLIGLVAGYNLILPAIAVEGADAFDAISRAFSYVRGRTWHMIVYNALAFVYGAITYSFLSVVVYLTLLFTRISMDWGYLRTKFSIDQFDATMPRPMFGYLFQKVDWFVLDWSGKCAAVFIHFWVWIVVASLLAYGISYYISASTWVYLLLRRAADGTEFDDVYMDPTSQSTEKSQLDSSLTEPITSTSEIAETAQGGYNVSESPSEPAPEPGDDKP